jgi:hypothetical protein
MLRALLAHPQEALHKRHLVYCACVLRQLAAPGLEWNSNHLAAPGMEWNSNPGATN